VNVVCAVRSIAASKAMSQANDGGSQVDILSLPPADLDKIRKSMAADVEVLTSNFGTLKVTLALVTQTLSAASTNVRKM
jgi:hypothetical protein